MSGVKCLGVKCLGVKCRAANAPKYAPAHGYTLHSCPLILLIGQNMFFKVIQDLVLSRNVRIRDRAPNKALEKPQIDKLIRDSLFIR